MQQPACSLLEKPMHLTPARPCYGACVPALWHSTPVFKRGRPDGCASECGDLPSVHTQVRLAEPVDGGGVGPDARKGVWFKYLERGCAAGRRDIDVNADAVITGVGELGVDVAVIAGVGELGRLVLLGFVNLIILIIGTCISARPLLETVVLPRWRRSHDRRID